MGTGKTLTLTLLGYIFQQQGIDIYSNYPVNFEHTPVRKPEEIKNIQYGVFLGDELWSWLDARTSATKKNRIISSILLKSRKRGYHIIHTAQFKSQPDKRLREHTDYFGITDYDKFNQTAHVEFYAYLGHDRTEPAPRLSFNFNAKPIFQLYDSYSGLYSEE